MRPAARAPSIRRPAAALAVALVAAAPTPQPGEDAAAAPGLELREVAAAWGLDFRHHHGGSGSRYLVETMGGGLAIFDYDGDGDEDVFFVDGAPLPGYRGEEPASRLYRNEGGGRFVDVTAGSGLQITAYGNGAVAGDVDGDGDGDLYVTALGPNQLFENRGDGTFEDATERAGVGDPLWGTSAAFGDLDRDGDLDLYVANYVDFTVETHRPCFDPVSGREQYCGPEAYPDQPDRYFRNRGDGTFEEASGAAGLAIPEPLAGLGAVFAELDGDGWPDLYVANDVKPNLLFQSRGDGTVEEAGFLSGTAVSERGRAEAGMGVDVGDVDGDGRFDLVVTNFEMESNAFYKNLGDGLFVDHRFLTGLAERTLRPLGFGVAFADLDHDADLDLVIANGHTKDNASAFHPASRYAQPNQLFENRGSGRFRELEWAGSAIVRVSRGLATGDLDRDGDLDLAIGNLEDRPEVYENLAGSAAGAWLQADLVGGASNREGIGARLRLWAAEGAAQLREVRSGGSYQSHGARTVHFGLAGAERAALEIDWPSGKRQRFASLPAGRRLRFHEGAVRSEPA